MSRPRDDEFESLRDLMRGGTQDDPDEPTVRIDRDQPPAAEPEPVEPSAVESRPVESRPVEPEPVEHPGDEPTQQIPIAQAAPPAPSYDEPVVPQGPSEIAPPPSYDEGTGSDEDRRKRLVLIGLGVLAVLLVLGAFGIGRMLADNTAGSGDGSTEAGSGQPAPYEGPVEAVVAADASASCQTENSVDGAGNLVSYEPAKAYDSNLATAWRCDGSGVGQRFTVTLPEETDVAEVGLVPGYAKTDPASGADRYAENNRITKVRWRFDDGSAYVQRMTGSATDRDLRTLRVPETATRRVVIEILASQPGPRNTVAISELRIATPAG